MVRPGLGYTIAAAALIVATGVALDQTATEALPAVRPTVGVGVILGVGLLALGASRWIGIASLPMMGAVMLEAGFGDDPSWIRATLVGCLWFVALEVSWEAIDRRSGSTISRAATTKRIQDVATVVGISLLLCVIAAAAVSFAPARSVLLQATVLGGLLFALVSAVRTAAVNSPNAVRSEE